jgi:hypothetical protein
MSPPADGGFPGDELDEVARRIDEAARAAYQRMLELIDQGVSPRDAIAQVKGTFDARYYDELSAAFTRVLDEPWTARAIRDYPVGPVKLSTRMYEHWRLTAAEATSIVRTHAQGIQQARDLALALYEGYGYRGVEPLKVLTRQFRTLPIALRRLAQEPGVRATLLQTARRAAATQLRTASLRSAYVQAFDAAIAGAGRARLERLLRTAVEEKSRYFANRIAQTELARAYSDRVARDFMADTTIDVVQWRLSGAHPRADVCDLLANVDRFGLGPGCYPKRKAPKPIAHPFCRCRLRSRPDLVAAGALERVGADAEYLAAMGPGAAARLLGSKERLRQVMRGRSAREVWNTALDDEYKVRLLGEPVSGRLPTPPVLVPPATPPVPAALPAPPIAMPPAVVGRVFEEQKTVSKAAAWAMQNDVADFADYAGVHVSVANQWNRSLVEHLNEFPELRKSQRFAGTTQGQLRRWVEIERTRYAQRLVSMGYSQAEAERIAKTRIKSRKSNPNIYAHSTTHPDVSGIAVNAKWGKDPIAFERSLASDVASKYHPINCDTVRSVVDHELGHQLDALLGLSSDLEVQQLYRQAYGSIDNEVSRYAGKNIAEFIAESWSESKNNPTPRPVAARVAEIIRERYRAKRLAAGP